MFLSTRIGPGARSGSASVSLNGLCRAKTGHPQPRYKSAQSMQVDTFPYQRLTIADMKHMSADMEYTSSIPLRSFFAQHKLLMPVPKPEVKAQEDSIAEDPVWVNIAMHRGHNHPTFIGGRPLINPAPEKVARMLGPFVRGRHAATSTKVDPVASLFKNGAGLGHATANPEEINAALSRLRSMMMQINEDNLLSGGGIGIVHLPIRVDGEGNIPIIESDTDHSVDATSVRRKRKLKMNRHKYRKRLKEQRTLRRRLGK